MRRVQVETVIAELARDLDLPGLAMNEYDYFCLHTEDNVFLNVDYFEDANVLSFYTTVAEIPETSRLEVLEAMLRANAAWEDTSGGTLCLDATEQLALLTISFPVIELDLSALRNRIQTFTRAAWQWSDRIKDIAAERAAAAEQATDGQHSIPALPEKLV